MPTVKKLTILIAMLMAISGCSKEVPEGKLVERNWLKYEVNSQTPFTGTAVSYYINDELEYKKKYKKGLQHGLSETYFTNGQLKKKEYWKDGIENGPFETYFMNGDLIYKGNIKDGVLVID